MIQTEIVKVTPEMAKKFLTKNTCNRKLSETNLRFLVDQMNAGKWNQNGESIKFSENGTLLDGQHRLSAIEKTGKSYDLLIIKGLKEETFNTIDTGRPRTAGDVIGVNGFKNHLTLAGTIRILLNIKNNTVFKKQKYTSSNQDILNYANENKDLLDFVNISNSITSKNRFITRTVIAACYYLFSKSNATKAEEFFDKYSTGISLEKGHPILALRERLIYDSVNKSKYTNGQKLILLITAWNAFMTGKEIKQLQLKDATTLPKIV